MPETRDDTVDEWLFAPEHEVSDNGLPVVAMLNQFVLEEIDKGALVFTFAEEVTPVVEGDLARRIFPWFVAFTGRCIFIDCCKMVDWAVEEIRGAEDLVALMSISSWSDLVTGEASRVMEEEEEDGWLGKCFIHVAYGYEISDDCTGSRN